MVAVIRGTSTASGKRFDILAPTAAHRSLPFGAVVLVENLANGRTIELRITDRGPYVQGRIIGLWLAAAQRLWFEQQGGGGARVSAIAAAMPGRLRGTRARGAEPTGGLPRRSDAVGRSAPIAAPFPPFAGSRSLGGASTG